MATDAFLKIEDIPGESTDAQYPHCIELLRCSFGTHQPAPVGASGRDGGSTGRMQPSYFTVTKHVDMASPKLMEYNCSGTPLPEVTLAWNRAGGTKMKFYEVVLEKVLITDYAVTLDDGEPLETVSLSYSSIKATYHKQSRETGGSAGSIVGGWSRETGKTIA